MRILLLNGPPRCGKDTVSRILKSRNASFVHEEKFASPMKRVVPLVYSVTLDHWKQHLDTAANKDLPCSEFFGRSPRQAQIDFSESYLKPIHGKDIFGKLLVRRLHMICGGKFDCAIISDSGFLPEAEKVIEEFGAENVQLWRIYREGCDYSGDSRNYINLDDFGVQTYEIENNGSMDDLRDLIEPLYDALVLLRDIKDKKDGEIIHQTDEEWAAARKAAAEKAFTDWPDRKISRIKAEV